MHNRIPKSGFFRCRPCACTASQVFSQPRAAHLPETRRSTTATVARKTSVTARRGVVLTITNPKDAVLMSPSFFWGASPNGGSPRRISCTCALCGNRGVPAGTRPKLVCVFVFQWFPMVPNGSQWFPMHPYSSSVTLRPSWFLHPWVQVPTWSNCVPLVQQRV